MLERAARGHLEHLGGPAPVVLAQDVDQLLRRPHVGEPSTPSVSASSAEAKPPSGVRRSRSRKPRDAVGDLARPLARPSPARGAGTPAAAGRCRRASSRSAAPPIRASTEYRAKPPASWSWMPPRAMASAVRRAIPATGRSPVRAACRSRNSSSIDGGNFGRAAEPAGRRVEAAGQRADGAVEQLGRQRRGRAEVEPGGDAGDDALARRLQVRPPVGPRVADGGQHLPERRHAVRRTGRVVGAAVERRTVGGGEDGHRPAAVAGQRLRGGHVDAVDVRALLAVDLDAHEAARSSRPRSPRPRTTRAP